MCVPVKIAFRRQRVGVHAGMRTARTSQLDADDSEEDDDAILYDENDDEPDGESLASRVSRIMSPARMLRRGEVAGALGDLGTFLPDVVALAKSPVSPLPNPSAMVFFSGAWSLWAGLLFDLPMPIQPMHAVVAVALTEGLSYPQIVASSVWLGGAFFVLGALGLITFVQRVIPLSVVRGLQLGLGLKVFGTGVTLAIKGCHGGWWQSTDGVVEVALLAVAGLVAVGLYGDRNRPASLVLFLLGIGRAVCSSRADFSALGQAGLYWPVSPLALSDISSDDWMQALYRSALPQLPVTLLNAVVSTARLATDLYPHRGRRADEPGSRSARGEGGPASVTRIALSIGLMNVASGWLGHFPSCHGCGGLAAQHLFGARTGSSMVLMGLVKMGLAVWLGPRLLDALTLFPNSVLGVLLALSGVELAVACRDMRAKADAAVMLIGGGLVLRLGTGPAFVLSLLAASAMRSREGET